MSSYRIDREIGRGGMAVVYAGWHDQLERPVALKVLAEHLAGDREFRARFLREARIASKLHHPNLVQTYDVTEVDGRPCIVMELVDGGTLERGQLSREDAAEITGGLAHAHSRGVVHRDLKPANLLRSSSGRVKIADFGIARAAEETRVTQIGTVLGTMRYLAPEQAEGRVVGPEADVYSLGVVFDELLDHRTASDSALLERMRADDPAERPSTSEVAARLRATEALTAETQPIPAPRRRRRERARGRASRVWLLAAAAAIAAATAVAVLAPGHGNHEPAPVERVPKASTAADQARNLSTWLKQYSGR